MLRSLNRIRRRLCCRPASTTFSVATVCQTALAAKMMAPRRPNRITQAAKRCSLRYTLRRELVWQSRFPCRRVAALDVPLGLNKITAQRAGKSKDGQ